MKGFIFTVIKIVYSQYVPILSLDQVFHLCLLNNTLFCLHLHGQNKRFTFKMQDVFVCVCVCGLVHSLNG